MKRLPARWVAFLSTMMVFATIAAVAARPRDAGRVRTDDRNGDGRPDVWRHYDAQGQPTEVDIDSNFDGRSDIQEYYERGELVRRESDRDFNNQVDLVEDFDATTHQRVRTTIDLDYDGFADLLILFQDGRPAFSKRVSGSAINTRSSGYGMAPASAMDRSGDDRLAPLEDPFRGDSAIRSPHATSIFPGAVGLAGSGGLPASSVRASAPMAAAAGLAGLRTAFNAPTDLRSASPRGPPAS